MNAELVKGTEEDLERFTPLNPMQQLDTETNVTEHSKRAVCNTTWYLRSRRTAHN
jgi:hypothetical protein